MAKRRKTKIAYLKDEQGNTVSDIKILLQIAKEFYYTLYTKEGKDVAMFPVHGAFDRLPKDAHISLCA